MLGFPIGGNLNDMLFTIDNDGEVIAGMEYHDHYGCSDLVIFIFNYNFILYKCYYVILETNN